MGLSARAQNLVCRRFPVTPHILLDSLPVEASSISVDPPVSYEFQEKTNTLHLKESRIDSISVCFRSVSKQLLKPFYLRDIATYDYGRLAEKKPEHVPELVEKAEIFSLGPMVTSYGAISRGISFGNQQNVFVNSALNLQMEGQLTEELKVSAVITDQNIPYQPEGNTQQIRDFDNVFIKLYNEEVEIIAGDVVLRNPIAEGYFLKYYKNVQGLSTRYSYSLGSKWTASSAITGSGAKGQFTSAQVDPIEGVQGPYKLRGPNGERFVIVLANSERVYVDGELMQRGFDRDYVIDYNLGEITFTSHVLITRFTRIRVDYEYADQFYGRSNLTAVQEFTSDRSKFYANFYQEKDNPNSTLGFDLTDQDIADLRGIGDQSAGGMISGVDSVGFIESSILYKQMDTVVNGSPYPFYQYSTHPDSALFKLSFTEVGEGNGYYRLISSTANGRVFGWVAPIEGRLQGNYEPIKIIPTPNRKRMMVFGSTMSLTPYEEVYQELALSDTDRNLYSSVDDLDNQALAWKGGIRSINRPSVFKNYLFSAEVSFEHDQAGFTPIDRFRAIEYDRNWSYAVFADSLNRTDQILYGQASLFKNLKNLVNYQVTYRRRAGVVNGSQQQLQLKQEIGPVWIRSENFYLHNSPGNIRSQWVRTKHDLQYTRTLIKPGYIYSLDHNTTNLAESDSVISTLMHYQAHNAYLETGDTSRTQVRLDYIRRIDQLPVEGHMEDFTEADEARAQVSTSFSSQQLSARLNYRNVHDLINRDRGETLLGRLDFSGTLFNKSVRRTLTYSTSNTRELQREFIFIAVPTGQGTHTWRDENEDGIQDLNEFYEAINPDEMNYAKIFTPTDTYIDAYQTTFFNSIDADFPKSWLPDSGWLSQLRKLSINTNVSINYKTTDPSLSSRIFPLFKNVRQEEYLFARNRSRFTLFYNRNAPGFGMDAGYRDEASKSLLSNGFELTERRDWLTNARVSFQSFFTIRLKAVTGRTSNYSDFLTTRNFDLIRREYANSLIWQPLNTMRFTTSWERRLKRNSAGEGGEKSLIDEYGVEITWLRTGKGNLNLLINWLSIEFTGDENTFLGYELLEALRPGGNQRWQLNWQQSLGKGLQMTLQYNGRKSPSLPAIHTGSVQMTAYF